MPTVKDAIELLSEVPSRTAIFTDFDGTIAPFVTDPALALPLPEALDALWRLVRRVARVAVISGRPVSFLAPRLALPPDTRGPNNRKVAPGNAEQATSDNDKTIEMFGLYGMQHLSPAGKVISHESINHWAKVVERGADLAAKELRGGVRLERKEGGFTLHWRGAPEASEIGWSIARRVASETGLLTQEGRMAVELVLPVLIDKGTTVTELATGLNRACFIGDDFGDIAAFDALSNIELKASLDAQDADVDTALFRALRIAVESDGAPLELLEKADLVLDGPHKAASFLFALADAIERDYRTV